MSKMVTKKIVDEQEFIEVDQETLKKALKALLTKDKDSDRLSKRLAMLYDAWEAYNSEYFYGELSHPLITIEKMNNKTLANYTHGEDQMGITNHIRFNINFVALNTEERVLETLRHEMIHQWQDEVLYQEKGTKPRNITYMAVNEDGELVEITIKQKKRPKDWHNKDFKDFAKVVGIPAKGDKCYGNLAIMPEPKSYNRKFTCGCYASNGYPLTVWSTRAIFATCKVCGKDYVERNKNGQVVQVTQSHVEKPGEDAIEITYSKDFAHFARFKSKEERDEFLDTKAQDKKNPVTSKEEGIYQKGHNKFKEGYTHWLAYNTAEEPVQVKPIDKTKAKIKTPEPEPSPTPVEPKPAKPKKPRVEKPKIIDKPKKEEPEKKKPASEEPKEPPSKPKKTPKTPKEKPKMTNQPKQEDKAKTERSYKNAEDLIYLYKQFGSIKGVSEYFGITPGTIIYQAKKLGVDFKKGVVTNEK